MTVQEFIDRNSDILISQIAENEFKDLTDGCVVFCIVAANGSKPITERTVMTAGYQLVVATNRDKVGKLVEVITAALTRSGYAKIDTTHINSLGEKGNKVLYTAMPLPANDPRSNNNWIR